MEKEPSGTSLFIFRRDLRMQDNTGLIAALSDSAAVIPIFILDPRQTGSNEYLSYNALQFMFDSLRDLDTSLKDAGSRLYLFSGDPVEVISSLHARKGIDSVFLNRDYTPFSLERDRAINDFCEKSGMGFHSYADSLLTEPEAIRSGSGKPYTLYTPFMKNARGVKVAKPGQNEHRNYFAGKLEGTENPSVYERLLPAQNRDIRVRGGRTEGLGLLSRLGDLGDYKKLRDYPAKDHTTHLSAHNKFGTVSIREVYHAIRGTLGPGHELVRQLYWRDFFTHVAFNFPRVFGKPFRERYEKLEWSGGGKLFDAWRNGMTGFPIVDAGMRELNATGFMHNRVRMIAASFLVKDLHIDWRRGEKYFAQRLADYDPCVNNGNWQWAASTGADAQPYFRIFNPWTQQKRFDPECGYVKTWVPELSSVEPARIHNIPKKPLDVEGYPAPVVDHATESARSKAIYASAGK